MKMRVLVGVVCLVFLVVLKAAPSAAQNWGEAPGSPYAVVYFPQPMAVTPSGTYLNVLNAGGGGPSAISTFRLNSDATLSGVSGSPFAADQHAVDIATDGRFVFVANGGSNTIGVFKIASGGGLSQVSGSPFASGGNAPQNLEVTPSRDFLVVTNAGSDDFDVFAINGTTGALTAVSGSPFSAGDEPQNLAIDSTSTRLIISNCLGDSFSVFGLNSSTGVPTEVSGSPFTGPDCPGASVLDPTGTFLYVDALNSFNGYSVAGDGTPTELSGSPYPPFGYSSGQGIAMSPGGVHVFTTGEDTSTGEDFLVVFKVKPDGNLEQEVYSPVPVVRDTFEVAAHPTRHLVFLADSLDDSVTVMEALVFSGKGTATVDGVMTAGEWDGADIANFTVNLIGGGTTEGSLYVMNDDDNLFLAVTVGSAGTALTGGVTFEFDNNADGQCDDGDDIVMTDDFGITDSFRTNGCVDGPEDTSDGGTVDGQGSGDGSMTLWEIAHPLASGDTGHDFDLGPGSEVGFYLNVRFCGVSTCADTDFPGLGRSQGAHIRVYDLGIFRDGFESGNTSAWSKTIP